jgi:hypothetical protein
METDRMSIDDGLALIHGDLQKVIRHFKLDRRLKNNSDDPDAVPDADTERDRQISEILERLGEIADRREFTAEQTEALKNICGEACRALLHSHEPLHRELQARLEAIGLQLDELKTCGQCSTVIHRHTFTLDFKNSKAATTMTVMGIALFMSGMLHIKQLDNIREVRDNDLKYRYIKMCGSASQGDIVALERVFIYRRNADTIRLIRRQVEQFEQLTKEQAEHTERARLNAAEAQRLQEQVQAVKGGR